MVTDELVTTSLLGRVRNGTWLDAQFFPPLTWIVPGLVPEGFGLLIGAPKIGKSWWVLGVALSVACGGTALGCIPVPARPVLYAALEDGDRRMQDRARKLMLGQPLPASFEYFTSASPVDILPMVAEWLDAHPTGVVFLDTLGKVMPQSAPGESAYQRDYRVGGKLKALTDAHPGSALLVVHHNRKMASLDWMDSTSGTQGLNGSADYTIVLERARGDGEAVLKVSGRDVAEGEYAVTMSGGSWALVGDSLTSASQAAWNSAATEGVGDPMANLIAEVNRHPEGTRPTQLSAALNMPIARVHTYLGRAKDSGRIANPSRGIYTPVRTVSSESLGDPPPSNLTLLTHLTPSSSRDDGLLRLPEADCDGTNLTREECHARD